MTFDLIGLPPTPEELDAFLARRLARRVREGRRSAARLAPLRRALGAALARRGAVRRVERQDELHLSPGLALPRLGHRRVQRRQAVRPVRPRADRRRPPPRRRRPQAGRADHRDRVPRPRQQGPRRGEPRAVRPGRRRRADRGDHARLPRADGRLRPLPRPQVRPDPPARLLRPRRHLPQHPDLLGHARGRLPELQRIAPDRAAARRGRALGGPPADARAAGRDGGAPRRPGPRARRDPAGRGESRPAPAGQLDARDAPLPPAHRPPRRHAPRVRDGGPRARRGRRQPALRPRRARPARRGRPSRARPGALRRDVRRRSRRGAAVASWPTGSPRPRTR